MDRAAFFALWGFVFVLPWDPLADLPVLGSIPRIAGLVAAAVGILHVLMRRQVRPLSAFHVFAILFVLWAGVSSFWSIDPEATRLRFITYLQLLLLAWLIWEIAWSAERQRRLVEAYVLGVVVAAALTIVNYLTGRGADIETADTRFAALGHNPNHLGIILAIGLPMAWYLARSGTSRRAWLWQLYLPIGLTAILLTASRGALLATLVALAIIPWTLGRLRFRAKLAVYVLAIGSLVVASRAVPEASLERLRTTGADIEARHFGGRIYIWMAGLEVAQAHPLLGVGSGAFGAAVAPALHKNMAAHQTFLEILVEQGIIGLLLAGGVVAAVIAALRRFPTLDRRLWIVLLLTLGVGALSTDLADHKPVWLVLALVAARVPPRRASRPVLRPSPLSTDAVPASGGGACG